MNKTQCDHYVRNLGKKDHVSILALEKENFQKQAMDAEDLDDMLRSCYALVVIFDHDVVGYLLYEKNRNDNSIMIRRICVGLPWRGIGAGRSLLEKVVSTNAGFSVRMRLREKALDAQLFLRSCGFRSVPIKYRKERRENSTVQIPQWIEDRGFENGDGAILMEFYLPGKMPLTTRGDSDNLWLVRHTFLSTPKDNPMNNTFGAEGQDSSSLLMDTTFDIEALLNDPNITITVTLDLDDDNDMEEFFNNAENN